MPQGKAQPSNLRLFRLLRGCGSHYLQPRESCRSFARFSKVTARLGLDFRLGAAKLRWLLFGSYPAGLRPRLLYKRPRGHEPEAEALSAFQPKPQQLPSAILSLSPVPESLKTQAPKTYVLVEPGFRAHLQRTENLSPAVSWHRVEKGSRLRAEVPAATASFVALRVSETGVSDFLKHGAQGVGVLVLADARY